MRTIPGPSARTSLAALAARLRSLGQALHPPSPQEQLVHRLPAILGEYAVGAGQAMKLSLGMEMAGPPFAELDAPLTGDERASVAARARLRVSLPQAHALQACSKILCSSLAGARAANSRAYELKAPVR